MNKPMLSRHSNVTHFPGPVEASEDEYCDCDSEVYLRWLQDQIDVLAFQQKEVADAQPTADDLHQADTLNLISVDYDEIKGSIT